MHIIKKCRKISRNIELNNFTPKTEEGLLKSLGLEITRQTIQNYKMLADMIPELEDLVDTGIVTPTTALAMMRNLSYSSFQLLKIHLGTCCMYPKVKNYFIWVHPSYQFCAVYIYIDSYYQEKNIYSAICFTNYSVNKKLLLNIG